MVYIHPTRKFGQGSQDFTVPVTSGLTEHVSAGSTGWHNTPRSNRITYTGDIDNAVLLTSSSIDSFDDVMVGDLLTLTATSDNAWNSFKDQEYEVVSVETEVRIVHPLNITSVTETSDFKIHRVAGTCNVTELVKGTKENVECGHRGNCNEDTGLCECFPGYHGSSCSTQETIV